MPSSGAYLLSQLSTAPNEHNTHNTCHKRACYKSQIPISRFFTFSKVARIPCEAIAEALHNNPRAWKECARWRYLFALLQLNRRVDNTTGETCKLRLHDDYDPTASTGTGTTSTGSVRFEYHAARIH
jgi:hypothetical protein